MGRQLTMRTLCNIILAALLYVPATGFAPIGVIHSTCGTTIVSSSSNLPTIQAGIQSLEIPRNSLSFQPTMGNQLTTTSLFLAKSKVKKGGAPEPRGPRTFSKEDFAQKAARQGLVVVEGEVLESLPGAIFRCSLDGAPETSKPILARLCGKMRSRLIKVIPGDRVILEMSPHDLTRGRIVSRS